MSDTRPIVAPAVLEAVNRATADLLDALRVMDSRQALIEEVVAAFSDLSFDDRRYLGTAFPRFVNALLALEHRL